MLHAYDSGHSLLSIRQTGDGFRTEGPLRKHLGYAVTPGQAAAVASPYLEGVWVRWYWDGLQLIAENDRFGFFPLFYAETTRGIVVSTQLEPMLGHAISREPDDDAIAVFLRLGYFIGDDTPFKAIRCLEAGQRLEWTPQSGLRVTTHAPSLSTTESSLSRQGAVDAYGERMQAAVESMLPPPDEKFCVPLSAGRDSRHILYALLRAGRTPNEVLTVRSAPPRPSTDADVASQITSALNLEHTIIEQPRNRFAADLRKNRLTGWMADEHAPFIPVGDYISNHGFDWSWDGIAGDIFSCGVYDDTNLLEQFRDGQLNEIAEWFLDDEGYLPQWMPEPLYQRCNRSVARDRLAKELQKYAHLPNPMAPFFFYNRVRRELALSPYGIMNQNARVLAPYLSHGVFDLLIDLPFQYFKGREFHSEAIDQFYPEMPKFPFVSTSTGSVLQSHARNRSFCGAWLRHLLPGRSDGAVKASFLIPRLLKGCVNRAFGTELPVLFARPLVMMDLFDHVQTSQETDSEPSTIPAETAEVEVPVGC